MKDKLKVIHLLNYYLVAEDSGSFPSSRWVAESGATYCSPSADAGAVTPLIIIIPSSVK
jgi:hypothetical protein